MYTLDEIEKMAKGRKKALKQKPHKKKFVYAIPLLKITRIESNLNIDKISERYMINKEDIKVINKTYKL